MSGGSMDYLCYKVEEANFSLHNPERKAFYNHLKLVAKALRDIEWNDSGDGADSETKSILKCLQPGRVLEEAIADAEVALTNLKKELKKAKI